MGGRIRVARVRARMGGRVARVRTRVGGRVAGMCAFVSRNIAGRRKRGCITNIVPAIELLRFHVNAVERCVRNRICLESLVQASSLRACRAQW